MDYHTLVSLYDEHRDAVSELENACERFNQAVIDMHSYLTSRQTIYQEYERPAMTALFHAIPAVIQ